MASARYTLNINPEDLKPEQPPEYTKKQKMQNWWHYSWKWIAAVVVILVIIGWMVHDVVTKVQPDYQIAVVTKEAFPDNLRSELETAFTASGKDVNGDGQVVVQVNTYQLDFTQTAEAASSAAASIASSGTDSEMLGQTLADATDPYTQMAAMTTFSADLQSGDSVIFLVDDPENWQQICQQIGEPGSTLYQWSNCPTLTGMDLPDFTDLLGENPQNSQQYLSQFYIACRGFGDKKPDHLPDDTALFDALTTGATA